jgi:5'(3')-deoxyribonucleotidase
MGLRIGIDLDGVVADFNRGWTRAWNEQHGTDVRVEDVDGWDVIPRLTGLRHMGEFWRWARDLGDGRSLFRDLPTFDGAIDAVRSLVDDGHHPVVLTAKPRWSVHDTLAWLADVRFPTTEVHILDDKWRVSCDVYVDDAPHVLADYVRHRGDRVVCRFVRPWNQEVEGTVATSSWDEVLTVVDRETRDGRSLSA